MSLFTTFYFSRFIGCRIYDTHEIVLGKILDVFVHMPVQKSGNDEPFRPKVSGLLVKTNRKIRRVKFTGLQVIKFGTNYKVQCDLLTDMPPEVFSEDILLKVTILDKQIVDINGRKLVRVNYIRMVAISEGAFAIAVDVGIEGLLQRIGLLKPIKTVVSLFNARVPSKFILWDDVEALDYSRFSIKLSKSQSKIQTLHPSDLADIIEDLGKASKTSVFSSLDEEKAADVLEELEEDEQINIIESLSVEKAADVLEKMPANEAADIIDRLEDERAEQLLREMNNMVSQEVRELLEYPDTSVGSIMTTNVLSFKQNQTTEDVLLHIRKHKPEIEQLYNLFVVDKDDHLIAMVSLRDLLISDTHTRIEEIMDKRPVFVHDYDKLDSLAEIVSKYNLLALPVTDADNKLEGMVVVDDIVEDLIGKGRTR